jgi:hypothetical protein
MRNRYIKKRYSSNFKVRLNSVIKHDALVIKDSYENL